MKTVFLSLAILTVLAGCKKEQTTVLIPGSRYSIRSDIFNKGAYQPTSPVTLIDLYIGPYGVPRSHCTAAVDWSAFALVSGNGVADRTVQGNQALISQGIVYGDPAVITWDIPQYDLK